MKFRKIISLVLLLSILLTFASCKSGTTEAKKVSSNLMTALSTYDLNAISDCVEDIPDNTGTASVVDIYTSDYYRDIYAAANTSITYSVVSNSATEVVLKVQMPDLPALYQKWMKSVISSTQNDETVKDAVLNGSTTIDPNLIIPAKMLSEIKTSGVSTVEKEIKLSVVKINGEYKIKNDAQLKYLLSNGLSEIVTYSTPAMESESAA